MPISSQVRNELKIEGADGSTELLELDFGYGFAAVPLKVFERLGWSTTGADGSVTLVGPEQIEVNVGHGTPFFRWNNQILQFMDRPYWIDGETYIPLQLLSDFFPKRLPALYAFDEVDFTIQAADPSEWKDDELSQVKPADGMPSSDILAPSDLAASRSPDSTNREGLSSEPITDQRKDPRRIVIIDPGHGGGDPGALGPQGLREKDVALAVAKIMADLLTREEGVQVHLTRSEDSFVPLWNRGELATKWKGEAPGVFISVHANSAPERRSARGFETYSLNVARTEHERRVVAIENASLQVQGQSINRDSDPEFTSLLRDLSNSGHQPWSVELSRIVQEEIGRFHPGPDRGIKQGPLAVLTNTLMPSVLVEVGFLSNEDEGPLLGQKQFQDETARALARAVMIFFDRYPPGTGED